VTQVATATTNGSKVIKPDHGADRKHMIFTQEHEDLRESMQAWVEKELWPHRNEWEETTWPNEVLKRAGELGFLGLCFPEEYGGQGGDYYYSLVRAECLSYSGSGGLNMGFVVHTDMVTPPIEMLGTDELKSRYLPPAIAGEKIGCLGITEPDAGSDVANIRTTAIRDGDEFVVNGSKMFITNGARADFIVLVVKTDPSKAHDGISLLVVDLRDESGETVPGFSVSRKLEKMGMHASDTAELSFEDVRVPVENLLGEEGKGFYHIAWELQSERMVACAGSVAGAQRMFERTLEYAKERKAFGRSIGNFQVIRHKFAEMATKIEAARQFTYATAWRYANGEYPVREISQAKLYTSRIACEVADECIQIHGGYGYMKEYEIERAYRDVRLNRIGAGTDEIMLEVIGRSYGI
jgi:alkylation response protein AidB-like acyl-CoA dehydrogenase